MADRVAITPGSGDFVLTNQVTHPVWGQGQAQAIKVIDGTDDSVNAWIVDAAGRGNVYIAGAAAGIWVPTMERRSANSTVTRVSATATAGGVTLLAANANRIDSCIDNESTALLYVLCETGTVSATHYTARVQAGDYYEIPYGYQGIIKGLWAAANGAAAVTEFTP